MLHRAAPAFIISLAATMICGYAAGTGLGLYLGAALLAAIYTPPLVLAEAFEDSLLAAAGCAVGVSVGWLFFWFGSDLTFLEYQRCCIVLAAWVVALWGIASGASRLGLHPAIASTLTVLLALAWLSWPVWLSPWLNEGMVRWLVPAHPLMAVNGVLPHLGTWDRAPIAYRQLTSLDQDVTYRLPRSILPAVLLHVALGVPALVITWRARRTHAKHSLMR